jgi:thiamine pyrophosphokinase
VPIWESAGWREAENAGDDQRPNFTKSAAPGGFLRRMSAPTISAHVINTDIGIRYAANEGYALRRIKGDMDSYDQCSYQQHPALTLRYAANETD